MFQRVHAPSPQRSSTIPASVPAAPGQKGSAPKRQSVDSPAQVDKAPLGHQFGHIRISAPVAPAAPIQNRASTIRSGGWSSHRVGQPVIQMAKGEPAWKRKARAKKQKAKKQQEKARKAQENRQWWLKAGLGSLVLAGTAVGAYRHFSGGSGGGSGASLSSTGSSGNRTSGSPGNSTSSALDQPFRSAEMVRLQQQQARLSQQPLSCPVIRDRDAIGHQMSQLASMSAHDYRHKAVSPLNPSKGKGHVVGMAGLPGSGKSVLQKGCTELGYVGADKFDDVLQNPKQLDTDYRWWNPLTWPRLNPFKWPDQKASTSVKTHAERGDNVVMSDPEFIKSDERSNAAQKVGRPVEWAFFENNPEQAKDNARFRKETATSAYDKSRNLDEEIAKIDDLSSQYDLPDKTPTHKIVNARKKYGKKKRNRKKKRGR